MVAGVGAGQRAGAGQVGVADGLGRRQAELGEFPNQALLRFHQRRLQHNLGFKYRVQNKRDSALFPVFFGLLANYIFLNVKNISQFCK